MLNDFSHDNKIVLPAEWEAQSAILISWPHQYSDWHDQLDRIEPVYLHLCQIISRHQKIIILCYDVLHCRHVHHLLEQDSIDAKKCHLIVCPTNDTWCRDYGPIITVTHEQFCIHDFTFNAWGEQYPHQLDQAVTKGLCMANIFVYVEQKTHDLILEGGSIDSNGQGTVLTTDCLLKRQPQKGKQAIDAFLKRVLGLTTIHCLEHGALSGDDTSRHIDNLARFVATDTIFYSACQDLSHPDYYALEQMKLELSILRSDSGQPYKLIPVELPSNILDQNQQRLPATYVNFLLINDAVILPLYDVPEDEMALDIFRRYFSDREVIGINSLALIAQKGSIHCATLQLPSCVLNE